MHNFFNITSVLIFSLFRISFSSIPCLYSVNSTNTTSFKGKYVILNDYIIYCHSFSYHNFHLKHFSSLSIDIPKHHKKFKLYDNINCVYIYYFCCVVSQSAMKNPLRVRILEGSERESGLCIFVLSFLPFFLPFLPPSLLPMECLFQLKTQ